MCGQGRPQNQCNDAIENVLGSTRLGAWTSPSAPAVEGSMPETGDDNTLLDRASPVYCADGDVHNPSVDEFNRLDRRNVSIR